VALAVVLAVLGSADPWTDRNNSAARFLSAQIRSGLPYQVGAALPSRNVQGLVKILLS